MAKIMSLLTTAYIPLSLFLSVCVRSSINMILCSYAYLTSSRARECALCKLGLLVGARVSSHDTGCHDLWKSYVHQIVRLQVRASRVLSSFQLSSSTSHLL